MLTDIEQDILTEFVQAIEDEIGFSPLDDLDEIDAEDFAMTLLLRLRSLGLSIQRPAIPCPVVSLA